MSKALKTSYSSQHRVESFFTGTQILFSSDGDHFFCSRGSLINKVSVVDGQVKTQLKSKNHEDDVVRFTKTHDDSLFIVAYQSGLIVKFNLSSDTIEREFKSTHNAPVNNMKTNAACNTLATGSSDGTIKLWNLKNHYCSQNLKGVNGLITCIEFLETADREMLFCSGGDDSIHVFDLKSGSRVAKLKNHCSTITDMAIVMNNSQLISVGRDKIAVVWDICGKDKSKFGVPIRTIPLFESVESIVPIAKKHLPSLSSDETVVFATLGEEGLIKFWDSKTGSKILSQNDPNLSEDRNPNVQCMQLISRPESQQLCAVTYERDLFFYDLPDLKLTQQLQGHIDEIFSVCWFADDHYVAIACNSNDLKVMNVETSKCYHLKGHTDVVLSVKTCPNNSMRLITSSKDCTVLIWDFEPEKMTSRIVFKATGHTHSIHALGALSTGEVIFSAGEDTTLKRWVLPQRPAGLDGSKTNQIIAAQTVKAHDQRIDDIAISPNDQLIATGSRDKTAKVFSADGLRIIATLRGHKRGVYAVRFSPVDQVLVTAADVCLRMWNLHDFTCAKTFQGHNCSILNFSFLSTGIQIVSIGSDGNMKLWDCKTNECIKTIDAHDGNTWGFSLTSDDRYIVTGGQDEKLVVWRDTTQEEQEERLATMQNRVVQEQDFANYIKKKSWRKALNIALKMENQSKTLNVLREILLEPGGEQEYEDIIGILTKSQVDFVIDCCLAWSSTAKNCSIAQYTLHLLLKQNDPEDLLKLPSFMNAMDQLKKLTEKSLNRYERLVQQATFADFFLNSFAIQ